MTAEKQYDCMIAGGGIVGLTLALLLGKNALRVAVIDAKKPHSTITSTFDLRVSAITRATQRVFSDLSLWDAMTMMRATPYQEMFVWDGTGNGKIHFSSDAIHEPNLGHIVENTVIQKVLLDQIERMPTIDCYLPAHITRFESMPDTIHCVLDNGEILTAPLLVGADGAHSFVRREFAFSMEETSYFHEALVATVKTEKPHRQTAMQRFFQSTDVSGTLAFLPLSEPETSSIVWTMQPEKMHDVMNLSDEAFKHKLTAAFDARLGIVHETSQRMTFPLIRRHAENYVKPRVALVGDAAHTLHPLAGQGLNLGIADAEALATTVHNAFVQGRDIGELTVLKRYQRERKGPNLAMIHLMSGFKHLFGSKMAPIRFLRNMGLNVVDHLTPIKHQMIRYAMGL